MTRRLTPAERLAIVAKDQLLDEIVTADTWDRFLVEQAVFAYGLANATFDCNQLREVLPELGHGYLGAAINSLRTAHIIAHTGQMVPSTSPDTHGHRIAVWELTDKGRAIAAQRRARPAERAA